MVRKRHSKHKHHKKHRNRKKEPMTLSKILFWFVVYGVLIWLFEFITGKYGILEKELPHYFFLGLLMVVGGRLVYSAMKHKTFTLRRFFPWTILYGVLLFLINLILGEIGSLTNEWIILGITSLSFTLLAIFFRRANINIGRGKRRNKFLRAPSQIFTGIVLLVFGILAWRFSYKVFVEWIGWAEGMAWSWLIGLGLIIAGFLTILAWWRNNVLQHRYGLKIGKW